MASSNETVSMALFCDFENVALGVRDAKYDKFDIKLVLERLLLKGSIVVKKAYCDWDRYKSFKGAMHEANFELIEIPHVRQSGKNSADIRLVVDALDLCYTKSHVNTFVIISGDSDFSPLVSKLRENAKQVIGVGVQQSTSDLLIANCDEFFFYDDLVRESQRAVVKRESSRPQKSAQPAAKPSQDEDKSRNKEDLEKRRTKAVEIAVQTFDALASERGDSGKIWASVLKNAIKRRKPDFNETYYGFRAFGNLLEEAHARGLLEFGRDEKSGAYVYRSAASGLVSETSMESPRDVSAERDHPVEADAALGEPDTAEPAAAQTSSRQESRRRDRGNRKSGRNQQPAMVPSAESIVADADEADRHDAAVADMELPASANLHPPATAENEAWADLTQEPAAQALESEAESPPSAIGSVANVEPNDADNTKTKRRKPREPRKTSAKKARKSSGAVSDDNASAGQPPQLAIEDQASAETAPAPAKKASRKTASSRGRRPRKAATNNGGVSGDVSGDGDGNVSGNN